MMPVLQLGGLALPMRGLLLLASFAIATMVGESYGRERGLPRELIPNVSLLALLGGLIGARLLFAAEHLERYLARPLDLLSLTTQGMAWEQGVVAALVLAAIYLLRRPVALADVSDALLPAVAVFWGGAALGAFFSGDAYGAPTTMGWGIVLWGDVRHPVQLYEVIAAGGVALALAALWPRAPYRGWVTWIGLALLGAARLLVEGFRGDPAVIGGGLRVSQIGALLLLLFALYQLHRASRRLTAIEGG